MDTVLSTIIQIYRYTFIAKNDLVVLSILPPFVNNNKNKLQMLTQSMQRSLIAYESLYDLHAIMSLIKTYIRLTYILVCT